MSQKPLHGIIPPTDAPNSFWREVVELAVVAFAYWATVRLGLLLVARPEGIASVWPASGLALAVLLLRPKRQWAKLLAVIFVTNAAGNLHGGNSLPVSLGYALANTLEAGLGAWVLTALCKSKITFERTREVLALLVVAAVMNGITALLGATVSVLAFHSLFTHSWMVWWAADGLGIVLVTPLIVSWAKDRCLFSSMRSLMTMEAVFICFTMVAITWLCFGPFTMSEWPLIRPYILFPFLFWLAFRLSLRCLTTTLLLCSVIAIWGTLHGFGLLALAFQTRTEHLAFLQMFLITLTCPGLILSSTINERKRLEQDLAGHTAHLKTIVETEPECVKIVSPEGTLLAMNPAGLKMIEVESLAQAQSRPLIEFVAPEHRTAFRELLRRVIQGQSGTLEFMSVGLRGGRRWLETHAVPLRDPNTGCTNLLSVTRDITDRKSSEQMLLLSREHVRHLVQNLETAREKEHKYFADRLHDELGQILTAIKIDLAAVADCSGEGPLKEKIGETQSLLSKGILGVHSLCHELRPGSLDDLGLEETLLGLVEDWRKSNRAECDFCAEIDEAALSDEIRTAVFRIVQEALTNVSCHAKASKVWINLVTDEQTLRLSVADNGRGMEPGTENKLTSFGLLRMREQLEALGGKLNIESSPGKGTRLEGTVPLTKKG